MCTQPGCLALQPATAAPTQQLFPALCLLWCTRCRLLDPDPAARSPSRCGKTPRWSPKRQRLLRGAGAAEGLRHPNVSLKSLQTAPSDLPAVPRLKASRWHPRGWRILPEPLVQSPQGPQQSRHTPWAAWVTTCQEATTSSLPHEPAPERALGRSEGQQCSQPFPAQGGLISAGAARQDLTCYHWKFSTPAEAAQNNHHRSPAGRGRRTPPKPGVSDAPC